MSSSQHHTSVALQNRTPCHHHTFLTKHRAHIRCGITHHHTTPRECPSASSRSRYKIDARCEMWRFCRGDCRHEVALPMYCKEPTVAPKRTHTYAHGRCYLGGVQHQQNQVGSFGCANDLPTTTLQTARKAQHNLLQPLNQTRRQFSEKRSLQGAR
jgi:hypothetical protein